MTHFNTALRQATWWRFCISLCLFYTTSASATLVPSWQECLATQDKGGTCLAVLKGNEVAWCASSETITNATVAIARVLPATVAQGSTQDLVITAPSAHFSSTSQVKISGNLTINQVSLLSASQLRVNLTVPSATPLDVYDVVINTDGEIAKGFCLLEVTGTQNHVPGEITLSNQTIANDSATSGMVVGKLTTSDTDSGDKHTYQLLEDNGNYFSIDGDELKIATSRTLAAGSYAIKVLALDSRGLSVVQSFNINVTGSSDEDGIADDVEAKAPQEGDGNGDGEPDNKQNHVASLPLKNGQYLTLVASNASCSLQRVKLTTEGELAEDSNNDYPYDLVRFEYYCPVASTINFYYHDLTATGWTVRSYLPVAQQWDEVTQSSIEKVSLSSGQALKVTVPLQGREDGQPTTMAIGLTATKKAQIALAAATLTVDEFGEVTTIDEKSGAFISIPVTRTNGSKGKVSVEYTIESGSATADQDYYSPAYKGTLTWEDGESFTQSIPLLILDDPAEESPENLSIALSGVNAETANSAELGDVKTTTVTIHDNDGAVCQKNDLLTLKPTQKTITLAEGDAPFSFIFSGGQGKIELQTPPEGGIAKALLEMNNNNANVTIIPIGQGETEFTVVDCAGSQAKVSVVVKAKGTTTESSAQTCSEDPGLALQPALQEITLSLNDQPMTITLSGGQKDRAVVVAPDSSIVTASVPNFPESAGASITLTGRKVGKTELIIGDCYSQAAVTINVVKQQCSTEAEKVLQPASQDITILLEQTDPTTIQVTGGQGNRWLSTAPDSQIVNADAPVFPTTGGGSVSLLPKAVGKTKLVINDDCGDFAVANVNVVSSFSLAHYCVMAKKYTEICESPDAQVKLPNVAMTEDVFGNISATMANFHYRNIKENRVTKETLDTLVVDMFIDPAHVGKAANLLLVALLSDGKHNQVYDGTNWRDIPKGEVAIEELPAFLDDPSLPTAFILRDQIIEPLTTLMNSSTGAQVFFGYRLKEKGVIVYNGMYPLIILSPNTSVMSASSTAQTSTTRIKTNLKTTTGLSGKEFKTSVNDPVAVDFTFYVDPKDVGKPADILLVAEHGVRGGTSQFYAYDGVNKHWILTPLENIASIAPESRVNSLPEILSGQMNIVTSQILSGEALAGEHRIVAYLGYRLDNGDIIHISPAIAPKWFLEN